MCEMWRKAISGGGEGRSRRGITLLPLTHVYFLRMSVERKKASKNKRVRFFLCDVMSATAQHYTTAAMSFSNGCKMLIISHFICNGTYINSQILFMCEDPL